MRLTWNALLNLTAMWELRPNTRAGRMEARAYARNASWSWSCRERGSMTARADQASGPLAAKGSNLGEQLLGGWMCAGLSALWMCVLQMCERMCVCARTGGDGFLCCGAQDTKRRGLAWSPVAA